MGTLSSIGVITGGDISLAASTKYRDAVSNSIENGFEIGSVEVQGGVINMGSFDTDPIDNIEDQYPAWYGFYVSGLLKNIALSLDTIPSTGALKPVGIFDPTAPVLIIIVKLQDLFLSIENRIGIPINDVLISQIDILIQKAGDIIAALGESDTEAFFTSLKDTLVAAFNSAGKDSSDLLRGLDNRKEEIENAAQEIIANSASEISNLIPSLPVPELDTSFMQPGLDITPIFAKTESDGYDGIVTKFVKLMTVFLSIPGKIIESITSLSGNVSQAVSRVKDSISQLLTNFTEGVTSLLNAIISIVWNEITNLLSISNSAILEIASIVNVVLFFSKCLAVSLVGFLLGPGLIAFAVGKSLSII